MKLFLSLMLVFTTSLLHSQTLKFKFNLPKRDIKKFDTIAFRPYTFWGNYKNGEIFYNIEFEKEPPNIGNFLENEPSIKENGFRNVQLRFEFFDSNSNKLLDQIARFQIGLKDGFAIPPNTDKRPWKHKIPQKPYKVKLTWSFYEQPSLEKIQEAYIYSSALEIVLFGVSKDYSLEKMSANKKWDQTWPDN